MRFLKSVNCVCEGRGRDCERASRVCEACGSVFYLGAGCARVAGMPWSLGDGCAGGGRGVFYLKNGCAGGRGGNSRFLKSGYCVCEGRVVANCREGKAKPRKTKDGWGTSWVHVG